MGKPMRKGRRIRVKSTQLGGGKKHGNTVKTGSEKRKLIRGDATGKLKKGREKKEMVSPTQHYDRQYVRGGRD